MNIAYIRVSTEEQAQNGYGLDAQLEAIRRNLLGAEPDSIYRDDVSGAEVDRPGLLAALAALKPGDVLIVSKRDRLARDVFLSAWIEKEAKKHGARIVSAAGEGTDSDDPAAMLMRHIIDAFAMYERQVISARTRAALQIKIQRGERCGGIRYGYQVGKDGKTLEPCKREEIHIMAAKLFREKGMSFSAVADAMNATGYTNRRGNPFTAMSVFRILKNRKEDIKNGKTETTG